MTCGKCNTQIAPGTFEGHWESCQGDDGPASSQAGSPASQLDLLQLEVDELKASLAEREIALVAMTAQRDELAAKLTVGQAHDVGPIRESTDVDIIVDLVTLELEGALREHGQFASCHEGYAVLLEELDELWDEVKLKRSRRDPERMTKESIQIAAMGCKFALFVREGAQKR